MANVQNCVSFMITRLISDLSFGCKSRPVCNLPFTSAKLFLRKDYKIV
jgi:hypothetical protein